MIYLVLVVRQVDIVDDLSGLMGPAFNKQIFRSLVLKMSDEENLLDDDCHKWETKNIDPVIITGNFKACEHITHQEGEYCTNSKEYILECSHDSVH